jgi:nicotinamidase-related amidase
VNAANGRSGDPTDIDLDSMVGDVLSSREPLRPRILDLSRTALVIIDMQYLDASPDYGLGRLARERGVSDLLRYRFERIEFIVPRIAQLAQACRAAGAYVVHVKTVAQLPDGRDSSVRQRGLRCVEGMREADILEGLTPAPADVVIRKTSSSAFTSTNIDWVLRNLQVDTLIGTGIVTSGCVEMTMRDAGDRGYSGILVEDGCGANSEELHQGALKRMSHGPLTVRSSSDVLADIASLSAAKKVLARA